MPIQNFLLFLLFFQRFFFSIPCTSVDRSALLPGGAITILLNNNFLLCPQMARKIIYITYIWRCVGLGQSEELLTHIHIYKYKSGSMGAKGGGGGEAGCPCALSFCKQFSYLRHRMLRAANNLVSGQL